ncbi:MAG: U32 family peptidase [Hyphomonadaceae bacterium]|nr:U32 family peptidase [Hyphomonadaceae bacterium]GIK50083.1 MAG: U32 family peptidase [Alphaproteobacteria bacterium]
MTTDRTPAPRLTLGPLLFHWPAERRRDFYFRIADEAPVDTVYLGEVICSKRAPFSEPLLPELIERLQGAGKTVVLSSLAEVMLRRERAMTAALADSELEVEVNDASALRKLAGRPHRIGALFNTYNEETMRHLASRGAMHFALPSELPRSAVRLLAETARELGAGVEVQVFGRASLALSARCYHARAHARTKDNCQFVCEHDSDGMELRTIEGEPWLAVNGIQTMSHAYLCMLDELPELAAMGVTDLRLSPHSLDMVKVAQLFRDTADGRMAAEAAHEQLMALNAIPALANGFWHGRPGFTYSKASEA